MIGHDTVIVFQCPSTLYTFSDLWCTKHKVDPSLVSSPVGVLKLLIKIHARYIMEIREIAVRHEFRDPLGVLSYHLICIQVENDLMIQCPLLVDKVS
jgi:hypothetical protein